MLPGSRIALLDILKQKPDSIDAKKQAIRLICETGSIAYTQRYLQSLEVRLRMSVSSLGTNPELEALLASLNIANTL